VGEGRDPRARGRRAQRRPAERAEREGRVQRREQRSARPPLDRQPLGVHRDVERAVGGADDEERKAERGRVDSECRQHRRRQPQRRQRHQAA